MKNAKQGTSNDVFVCVRVGAAKKKEGGHRASLNPLPSSLFMLSERRRRRGKYDTNSPAAAVSFAVIACTGPAWPMHSTHM